MSLPEIFDLSYPAPYTEFLIFLKWPALDFTIASTGVACFVETDFYFHVVTVTIIPILLEVAIGTAIIMKDKIRYEEEKDEAAQQQPQHLLDQNEPNPGDKVEDGSLEEKGAEKLIVSALLVISFLVLPVATVSILKVLCVFPSIRMLLNFSRAHVFSCVLLRVHSFLIALLSSTGTYTSNCERFDNGDLLLRADFSVDCESRESQSMRGFAGLMIIVYPIGVT